MPKGHRLLSEDDEQRLYSEALLRDFLTDKALARRYNLTVRAVQIILYRIRRRMNRQNETNCVSPHR